MKLIKLMQHSSLFIAIVVLFAISCQKNELIPDVSKSSKQDVEEMVATLKNVGLDEESLSIRNDYFLYEGDIVISFETVRLIQENNDSNSSRLKAYRYAAPFFVTQENVRDIRIFIKQDARDNGWSSAIISATYRWNEIDDCCVKMKIVASEGLADIVISTFNESSGTIAKAPWPTNGIVGDYVKINTQFNNLTADEKLQTIVHELGHTIGFAHADGSTNNTSGTELIPGTSPIDNVNAVMHAFSHTWFGFSADEILAAQTLFPEPLQVSISGPSCFQIGYNTSWTANASYGNGSYAYTWTYLIRRGTRKISGVVNGKTLTLKLLKGDNFSAGVRVTSGAEVANNGTGFLYACSFGWD